MKSILSFRPGLVLGFFAALAVLAIPVRAQSFITMYVTDGDANTVSAITPAGVVSTFATGLNDPNSLAIDASGNLYVTNNTGNTVSKITPVGVVSTFASGFNSPTGLAFDASGNLYVANFNSGTVSKITPAGVVSTFVSGFNNPMGLAFDSSGNLYVANFTSDTVSEVTPAGVVSTFASSLNYPNDLAFDASGNLYVANYYGNTVSKVTPAGVVSIFASGLDWPSCLAFDTSGNLYVTNDTAGTVSEVSSAGVVSTFVSGFGASLGVAFVLAPPTPAAPLIYAQPQNQAIINGRVVPVAFNVGAESTAGSASYQWQVSTDSGATWTALSDNSFYSGTATATLTLTGATSAMAGYEFECIVTNALGSVTSSPATITSLPFLMFAANEDNNTVSEITPSGAVGTFAAGFDYPSGLALDGNGNLYVANYYDNTVSKVTPAGVASIFATGFNGPEGLVFDGAGNLYVTNYIGGTVSKVTPIGFVSIFATGFNYPTGLVFDGNGDLYVANESDCTISKITPAGVVSTFATGFDFPEGLACDGSGNLYVANAFGNTVALVTPGGVVSTFASGFDQPTSLAFDASGNLYVANNGNNTVAMVTPAGIMSTFASGFSDRTSLVVIAAQAAPTIIVQPQNQGVMNNLVSPVVFNVGTSGISGSNLFQWQVSTDGGVTWTAVSNNSTYSGVTTANLTVTGATSALVGYEYECMVTNTLGSVTSNSATLTSLPFIMFAANTYDNTVSEITPFGAVSLFASGFNDPVGMVTDGNGNLYVANELGNTVSEITPSGVVSTFASGFDYPTGLAFDASGNLYVANYYGNTVSKVTPAGVVSTFASGFYDPDGLAFDENGNLYVANYGGGVSKVTPAGGGSTFASDLDNPSGLAFDGNGNLYVANYYDNMVSKVTPAGVVSTFASGFDAPEYLAFDAGGNLYVTNNGNDTVSMVTPAGVVSTFASWLDGPMGLAIVKALSVPTISAQPQNQGIFNDRVSSVEFSVGASGPTGSNTFQWQVSTDGGTTWTAVSNNSTYSGATTTTLTLIAVTSAMVGYEFECVVTNTIGSVTSSPATFISLPFLIFAANADNNTVSAITPSGTVGLFASDFNEPSGLAFDASGNLYVANEYGNTVLMVTPAGVVSTFASGFDDPSGLALDGNGNLYVANASNNTVSKVTPAGVVSTFASGLDDPSGLAFDGSGNLYVANSSNNTISKVTLAGVVSTFASGLDDPSGLAFDGSGNLYVANSSNNTVSKVTPTGVVSTFASGLDDPSGLAFDGNGNLYVVNSSNNTVSEITPVGIVSTFASGFDSPMGLAILTVPAAPTIAAQPQNKGFLNGRDFPVGFGVGAIGTFGANTFQWQASINGGLTWIPLSNNSIYSGVTSATLTLTGTTSAMAGYEFECVVTNTIGSVTSSPAALTSLPFLMFAADFVYSKVFAITPAGTVSTFATGFDDPFGLAIDANGNLYVANKFGNTVSKVTPSGVVSTFASGFDWPEGLAFDGSGNLYVANENGNTVSKVTPTGVVSTFASGFYDPAGLAFDASGNLYVANDNAVSKVTPAGVVSTFASGFYDPAGLAFDGNGNLYVANYYGNTVSKVTSEGAVSTFASGLSYPEYLAFDASGNLYVTNGGSNATVSIVTPAGVVSTFTSGFYGPMGLAIVQALTVPAISTQPQNQGIFNGRAAPAVFSVGASGASGANTYQWQVSTDGGATWTSVSNNSTYSGATTATLTLTGVTSVMAGYEFECMVTNAIGSVTSSPATLTSLPFLIYVADAGTGTISAITPTGTVSAFASGLNNPEALAFDNGGNLYVANWGDNTVSKITPAGTVSTFASGFGGATAIVFDGSGNLYVANYSSNTVSKVTPAGTVSTFASGFSEPAALVFDKSGNLYVANFGNDTVSAVTPAGVVSAFAAGFDEPIGLVFDQSGNLYVADFGSDTVSEVSPAGVVSTFANGFNEPLGLVFDGSGNLDVANVGNGTVFKVSPAGVVSTLASGFTNPTAIAIISSTAITTQPMSVTAGNGQTAVFSVTAAGTSYLTYQWNFDGSPITGATDAYLVLGNVQAANASSYTCTVTGAAGSITSNPATLTVVTSTDLGRIMNMSIRDNCGTGANNLIAGFVIGGPGNDGGGKTVLVRGVGPTLASYGVTGALPDPFLNVFEPSVSSTSPLYFNDGWNNNPTIASVASQVGAFALNAGSLDSASVEGLIPGAYTANISGGSGDTGIALAEVYDATTSFTATTPRLINVSGRAQVSSGAGSLIAGFVVGGSTEKTVLVRGMGPTLAGYGVIGTLPDPMVSVFQPSVSTTVPLASNTVWGGDAAISTVANAVGAYPFAGADSADSALLISLPPGVYTANVTGASGDTGIALVEVYEVP